MRSWLCALLAMVLACWQIGAAPAQTLEDAVLDRINFARQYPQRYADELRHYRRYFDGRVKSLPGDPIGIVTQEGTDAVDEAIAFLDRQAPLPPLDRGTVLALTADDFARVQGERGARGHIDPAGASPGERVRRHGGDIYVGEGIAYGIADPDEMVRQMIVDDGVPNRGHRVLLFDPQFRFAGVGCHLHRVWDHICVVDVSATSDGSVYRPQFAARR